MMQKRSTLFDKQSMDEAFDLFDLTKTGQISKSKMRKALAGI
jgi:Ca2+-binding EF-hand superfamily protein